MGYILLIVRSCVRVLRHEFSAALATRWPAHLAEFSTSPGFGAPFAGNALTVMVPDARWMVAPPAPRTPIISSAGPGQPFPPQPITSATSDRFALTTTPNSKSGQAEAGASAASGWFAVLMPAGGHSIRSDGSRA
jgi:hypothetical protein